MRTVTEMTPTDLCVESETRPLRHVLVHRPGDEVVRMTQHELDRLLFDDILSPAETVREHDLMVEILRGAGAETVDVIDLLERALDRSTEDARRRLVDAACALAGAAQIAKELASWPSKRLADALVRGVYWSELDRTPTSLARLRATLSDDQQMALRPVPNLMFMRDPCVTIGDHVMVGRMATDARSREPLLVAFAIREGGLVDAPKLLFAGSETDRHPSFRRIEGGDVLVLSPKMLLIGCSQRTSAQTIERFAYDKLFPTFDELERVYVAMMPEARSVMHLDTSLTQIDDKLFLGHQPLVAGGAGRRGAAMPVARLERDREPAFVGGASVLDVLREELGADTELLPCGGDDPLHQEREQWTDGANSLCLAPGRILLYARNVHTIAALSERGFKEIRLHWVQPAEQRAELIAEGMKRDRTVFSFSGSELSRARGGGRCLTMPLRRSL